MSLDARSLADNPSTLAEVPIFLGPLPIARAVPAVLDASLAAQRAQVVAAGLLRATR